METPTEEDLERFARSPQAYPSQPLQTPTTIQPPLPTLPVEAPQLERYESEGFQIQDAFTLEITSCPSTISSNERFMIGIRLTYNADPAGRGRPVILGAKAAPYVPRQSSIASSSQTHFPIPELPTEGSPFSGSNTPDTQQMQPRSLAASAVKIFPGQSVSTQIEIDPAQWNLRAGTTYRLLSLGAEMPAPGINSWRWGTLEELRTNPIPVANEAYDLNGQLIILARSNSVRLSVQP